MLKVYNLFCNASGYPALCFAMLLQKKIILKNVYYNNFGVNSNLKRKKHHVIGLNKSV